MVLQWCASRTEVPLQKKILLSIIEQGFKIIIKSFLFHFLLSPIATDKIKGGKIILKGLGNVIIML